VIAHRELGVQPPSGDRAKLGTSRAMPKAENDATQSVERLRTEVALMRNQVLALSERASDPRAIAAEPPTASDQPSTPATVQSQREESARRWKEHMAQVAADFEREPVDQDFMILNKAAVDRTIQSDPVILAATRKVDCRSHTCRVEMQTSRSGQVDRQLLPFLQSVGRTLPKVQVDHFDADDGQKTVVLYLSNQEQVARAPR